MPIRALYRQPVGEATPGVVSARIGAQAPVEEVTTVDGFLRLTADEDNLYAHHYEGIRSLPIAGGDEHDLLTSSQQYDPMVIVGGAFFGVEFGLRDSYTVTLPLAGGTPQRIGKYTSSYTPERIVTDGARFVGSVQTILTPTIAGATLTDGALTQPGNATALAVVPPWRDEDRTTFKSVRAWDANATDVYLGYEGTLYRIPRPQ